MTGRRIVALLFAVAVLAVASLVTPSLRRSVARQRERVSSGSQDSLRDRNQSAFASILGEVRATASDLMFMKTSRYLHAGVAYAPKNLNLTADQKSQRFVGCDAGVPTVIRSAQEDFRGFLGDLERQVKPYRPANAKHTHTEMQELIPWFRVMTLTNPHYVRGYRVGASALLDQNKWRDAYDFLQEGLENNPDNPQRFLLFQSLCSYHVRGQYAPDLYPFGDAWPERALAAAREGYRLGLQQRPEGGEDGKIKRDLTWNSDLEEDFGYVAHMVPLLLAHMGRTDAALRQALDIAKVMPNYDPLKRTIQRLSSQPPTANAHDHDHEMAPGDDPAKHPMLLHMAEVEGLRVNTGDHSDILVHSEKDGRVYVAFSEHFLEHLPKDALVRLRLTDRTNTLTPHRYDRLLEDLHGMIAHHEHHDHEGHNH